MKRALQFVVVAIIAAEAFVIGQGGDVARVLSAARAALGGEEKLAAIKTLAATGRSTRTRGDGTAGEADFELSMALPDKYMKRDLLMAMGPTSIYRNTGFNGNGLINITDAPPSLTGGGGMHVMAIGAGQARPGQQLSKEQMDEINQRTLISFKQDFAKLTLGMFATSFAGYPLEFSYGGQAEAPDGKADVILVKGEGNFAAKLFIDGASHLPLMLSWMDKEPMVMTMGPGGGAAGGGGVQIVGGGGGRMTQADIDQMMKDAEARMKEAEAQRRVVEYRAFYADYKVVDGVKLPMRIQRMVDGKATEEIAFDKIKLNAKIEPKTFQVNPTGGK